MTHEPPTQRSGSVRTALLAVLASLAFAAALAGCGGGSGSTGAGTGGGTKAEPPPGWFAPTSVWNRRLAPDALISANSDDYVGELERQVKAVGPWINTSEYSTPVYTVPAGQPKVGVRLRPEPGETIDPALRRALASVPIPPGARPAAGEDGHLVVWQPSTDRMWEFWQLRREGGGWIAAYGGAMQDVSTNPGYYDAEAWPGAQSYWGATASSLPLVAGLMTIPELQEGRFEHTLAMAIPEPSSEHVWPAQRSDGGGAPGTIPEGTMFRLPADLDVKALKLPPTAEAIALAVQRYGVIVRDISGVVAFYGETPHEGGNPYGPIFGGEYPDELLSRFPWSKLEVVAPEPPAGTLG